MRIMHISTKKHHPGVTHVVFLQSQQHDVVILVCDLCDHDPYTVTSRYTEGGINYIHVNVPESYDFKRDPDFENAVLGLLKEVDPDVIHVQFFAGLNVLSVLHAGFSTTARKVVTLHDHALFCLSGMCFDRGQVCPLRSLQDCMCGNCQSAAKKEQMSLAQYNRIRKGRSQEIIALADVVICGSHWQRDVISRLFGKYGKIQVLYLAFDDPPEYKKRKSENITADDLQVLTSQKNPQVPCFGYLGSLWELKGVDVFLEAIDRIRDMRFQVLMGIRCDPQDPHAAAQLKKIQAYPMIHVILNLLWKNFYEDFFRRIDYLVIPSLWEETGPMTLFEAFFYKTPVLIADHPSMVEKVKEGVNAFVFDDAETLAGRMKAVIEGRIAPGERTRENFPVATFAAYASALENLYARESAESHCLTVNVGSLCNSNCIFCVRGTNEAVQKVDFDILKGLLETHHGRFPRVKITGGEPTVRKDFVRILEAASQLGYKKIIVETNARMFASAKLTRSVMPYHPHIVAHVEGHHARIHDVINRAPGSFLQTVSGIRNIVKSGGSLAVKVMIVKQNYRDLVMTSKLITRLGVGQMIFAFVDPGGYADKSFDAIVPRYGDVRPYLEEALLWLMQHARAKISLECFPFCCLDPMFWGLESQRFDGQQVRTLSYAPQTEGMDAKMYAPIVERRKRKEKSAACSRCRLNAVCEGVYARYIQSFGWEEFRPV